MALDEGHTETASASCCSSHDGSAEDPPSPLQWLPPGGELAHGSHLAGDSGHREGELCIRERILGGEGERLPEEDRGPKRLGREAGGDTLCRGGGEGLSPAEKSSETAASSERSSFQKWGQSAGKSDFTCDTMRAAYTQETFRISCA